MNDFIFGLKKSITIAIGYAPVALTFGILALKSGLTIWEIGTMSLLVFAGAAQFIALELFNQGATIWFIVLTTLIGNVRHVVMGFSFLRFFSQTSSKRLLLLAQGITDETFVLNSRLLEDIHEPGKRNNVALGVNIGAFSSWVIFSFIGAWLGSRLVLNFSGFDFALLALFIVLTVQTLNRKNIITYVIAGLLAIVFKLMIPGKIYILLSVGFAVILGALIQRRMGHLIQQEESPHA